jgi:hypothetical protein
MRRAFSLIISAALLALPGLSSAQDKPAGFTFTPYGFALLNSYWNAGVFTAKDNPGQAKIPTATDSGGAFLMMARYSRLGFRLGNMDSGFLGAELSGVLEMDWGGGYIPTVFNTTTTTGAPTITCTAATPPVCTATAPTSTSTTTAGAQVTAWQAPLLRLRLASGTLSWKTDYGTWRILIGQDYGLIGPVFAQTLAYVGAPIFVAAGKIYRRTPEVRLTYSRDSANLGFTAAVAALNPNDVESSGTTPAVDFGSGNRSRVPDLEGRVGFNVLVAKDLGANFGFAYHSGWRRYYFGSGHLDRRATTFGVDLITSLTSFLEVRGEWYQSKGNDDGENGMVSPSVAGASISAGTGNPANLELVHTAGWWFQSIFKPLPQLWLTFGHGITKADKGNLAGDARYQNEHTHAALLVNASKNLRLSAEYAAVASSYITSGLQKANQYSLNGQFSF